MAFDYLAGRILMFGAANVADETWGWDGTSWSQLAAGPGTWGFHALASDPARGRVVLFGRVGSTATSNETWEWDGSAWTQLQPAAAPSFREGHRMTFVPQRQRVVLHGGYSMVPPNSILSDLWEWDGITWSLVAATGAPARAMHGMAHDPVRGRTMIVGGFEANDDPGDTWEWDGTSWSQRTAAAPCWSVAAIAYDSLRARLVAVDAHLGTLEWDGVHWLPGPPSPTLSWN